MEGGEVPFGPLGSATVPHRLILRIEFTAPLLQTPVFTPDAGWLQRLGPALAHSGIDPARFGRTFVRLRLTTPAAENGTFATGPEVINDATVDAIVAAFAARGWETTAAGVLVREEAHPGNGLELEVAVYAADAAPSH